MRTTLEENYKKVQETQDAMNESMNTMERSMTVMMEQLQESNQRVATVFDQTSKQAITMMEMQITLANINRVLNSVTGYVNSHSDEVHIPMDIVAPTNTLKRSNNGAAIITQKSPKSKSTSNEAGKASQASEGGKNN